jgi:hypothetical protein
MTSAGTAFGDFSQDSDLVNYDSPSLDAEARSVTSKQSRPAQAASPSNQGVTAPTTCTQYGLLMGKDSDTAHWLGCRSRSYHAALGGRSA